MSQRSTEAKRAEEAKRASPSVEERVRALQTTLLFERSLVPIGTGIAFAGLTAFFAWDHIARSVTVTWLGLKVLTAALRGAVQIGYRTRARAKESETALWERLYLVTLVLDGAVWGLVGTWLVRPDNPVSVAAALALLVGVSAVGSHVFSSHGRAYACFTLPILLPTAAFHVVHSGEMNALGAVALLGYLAQSAMDVKRSLHTMRELTRLRYEIEIIAEARARALVAAAQSAKDREVALEMAEASNEAKGRFLATMSHEMRTPLNGMLGSLQLLERRLKEGEDLSLVELAEGSGRELLSLIDDVLDFAELTDHALRLEQQPFDVRTVVAESIAFAVNSKPRGNVAVVLTESSLASAWTVGDPNRCRQIVTNLVQNAKKFSTRGEVTVHIEARGEAYVISVRDDGIGIDVDAQARIFDPFHQVDASLGRKFEGAGLGLPIARELARAMGGDVRCAESTLGKGSTFELEIPKLALPAAFVTPPPSDPPPRVHAKPQVMLVDDNELNALLGRRMLEELGLSPIIRMGGAEAVRAAFEADPDLIFLDIQMPEVDGIEATRQIRERERVEGRRRVPIVALTAHAQSNDRTRFLAAGMDEYIPKPYRLADIAAAVARFVGPLPSAGKEGPRGA